MHYLFCFKAKEYKIIYILILINYITGLFLSSRHKISMHWVYFKNFFKLKIISLSLFSFLYFFLYFLPSFFFPSFLFSSFLSFPSTNTNMHRYVHFVWYLYMQFFIIYNNNKYTILLKLQFILLFVTYFLAFYNYD